MGTGVMSLTGAVVLAAGGAATAPVTVPGLVILGIGSMIIGGGFLMLSRGYPQ
jgi:amino acid transporter